MLQSSLHFAQVVSQVQVNTDVTLSPTGAPSAAAARQCPSRHRTSRGSGDVAVLFYYLSEVLFPANGQTLPVHIRHNNLYGEVFPGADKSLATGSLDSPQIDNRYGNPVCAAPTVVVPGCVSAATSFSRLLPITSAGQVDVIQFTMCADYNAAVPNTLRVIRPVVFCLLPSPEPCSVNSGLSISSATASGTPVFGPFPVQGNSALSVTMSGSQGTPGQSYCLSLRQTAPWEGGFDYEFRLSGTPPL